MSLTQNMLALFRVPQKAGRTISIPHTDDEGFDLLGQAAAMGGEQKTFDWNHYNAVTMEGQQGAFTPEFDYLPTIRTLKAMFVREPWVAICLNAISRQFMNIRFAIERKDSEGKVVLVNNHPLLELLHNPGSQSSVSFHSTNVIDLVLAGNVFLWLSPNSKKLFRMPAERMNMRINNGKISQYEIYSTGTRDEIGFAGEKPTTIFLPEEMVHVRMPNPYSNLVGLSMVIAMAQSVLMDRYGSDFILGFLLRGGNMSGVIETETNNAQTLLRLAKSLMQAAATRRNMHADKILPQGTKWVGGGHKFSEIQLQELLNKNSRKIMAAFGVPPIEVSDSDGVNYANAEAQMRNFWQKTIVPLQLIYCSGLQEIYAPRFQLKPGDRLVIDNSNVAYLDDFDKLLEQDAKIAPVATVKERRQRLRMEPLGDERDNLLASEVQKLPAPTTGVVTPPEPPKDLGTVANEEGKDMGTGNVVIDELAEWKATEGKLQDAPLPAYQRFDREFKEQEQIVLDNLKNQAKARKAIHKRADAFAKKFAEVAFPKAMQAYDQQMGAVLRGKALGVFVTKDSEQDRQAALQALRERAAQVMKGEIEGMASGRFKDYTDTMMERVYKVIEDGLAAGKNTFDVAADVRDWFEKYTGTTEENPGQALTIVRTEYQSAIAQAQAKFGADLATVTKTMRKTWMSKIDDNTRDSHRHLDNHQIESASDTIMDKSFPNGLRFPKDPQSGKAEEVINCRCTIRYSVVQWKE